MVSCTERRRRSRRRTKERPLCLFILASPFSLSLSFSPQFPAAPMASSTYNRWLRPEVYPIFVVVGAALGICSMQLIRNITTNPEVRVTKKNRAAGVLDNFAEGERYKEHIIRKFSRNRPTEIMPSINKFFSDPK